MSYRSGYTRLGVNVDHVATVRQARMVQVPDPVEAAVLAELGGCDGIIVHLREDRRHVQDRDLSILRRTVKTGLNLEMDSTQEMIKIALEVKPQTVTLVPERREELTTEGGLEVAMNIEYLKKAVRLLQDADIRVSLFVDPDIDQVKQCFFRFCGLDISFSFITPEKVSFDLVVFKDLIISSERIWEFCCYQCVGKNGLAQDVMF